MPRSFKCIEISLSDQTLGAETLSNVCVLTNESRAQNQLSSNWYRHKLQRGSDREISIHLKLLRIQSIGKCVKYIHSRKCPQPKNQCCNVKEAYCNNNELNASVGSLFIIFQQNQNRLIYSHQVTSYNQFDFIWIINLRYKMIHCFPTSNYSSLDTVVKVDFNFLLIIWKFSLVFNHEYLCEHHSFQLHFTLLFSLYSLNTTSVTKILLTQSIIFFKESKI